jgi:hypothetical protein
MHEKKDNMDVFIMQTDRSKDARKNIARDWLLSP